MKKRENLLFLVLGILLVFFAITNPVNSEFLLSNSTATNLTNATQSPYNIEVSYAPSETIKGWINIKFMNESSESLLSGFDNTIRLKSFLDANSASYTCFPSDCSKGYTLVGADEIAKTFYLAQKQSKILGIRITGSDVAISGISFNISSDAGNSCIYPLKINILNDDLSEWQTEEISNESCFIDNPYGCFDKEYTSESLPILDDTSYCEKIKVPPLKAFRIGANVAGKGNANFKISMGAGEIKECDAAINQSGEASCVVEFEEALTSYIDAEVCITSTGGTIYNISEENYANALRCGRMGGSGDFNEDFEIFVKPVKYKGIEKPFAFNQNLMEDTGMDVNLAATLSDYILEKYNKKCAPECIIPIKFESGSEQQIKISDIKLDYKDGGKPYTKNRIYEVTEGSFLINSGFLKLDLSKANILVPSSYGVKNFTLMLGDKRLLEQAINVKKVPKIVSIYPKNPPALVPVNYFVFLEGAKENVSYTWDFGDGSALQTSKDSSVKHTYNEMKDYEIKVTVQNDYGETSRIFSVSTSAPGAGINETIREYRKNIEDLKKEINAFPDFIKKEVEKRIDVDYLKGQVDKLEVKYKETLSTETEELTKIMKELLALKVPYKIEKGYVIAPISFIQSDNQIDLVFLEELGAGTAEKTKEEYYNSMNSWIMTNLNATLESDTYTFYFSSGTKEIAFSDAKITLEPQLGNIGEFYIVINGDPTKIKINGDYKTKDFEKGVGITLTDVSEKTTIEFIHPDKIDPINIPVYISPELANLDFNPNIAICNNNGVCEKSRSESYRNCRSDCKPWGLALLFLLIVLIIAIIIYIILQQWYKRNYERHLFKDRNQLFNLVNFMSISSNQGMKKDEIFHKLLKLRWKKEQLDYAWNKVKGKPTGMYEIPILSWIKNIKIGKKENKVLLGGVSLKPPQQNQGFQPDTNKTFQNKPF